MRIERPGSSGDRPREDHDQPDTPQRRVQADAGMPAPDITAGITVSRAEFHREYQKTVQIEYREYAIDRGCDRVKETEETITTPEMRRIEGEDLTRKLVGLEHRLKGRDRLVEKVTESMEQRGHTAKEAFGLVKDAIRYTFQYTEKGYARGVAADCERLKAAGFEPVDRKNSWNTVEYKGINSRWRVPDNGQLFEVQFHTRASFEAKQETHTAYERLRSHPEDENEVRQLRAYQREVSARIPMPPGAAEIADYRRSA